MAATAVAALAGPATHASSAEDLEENVAAPAEEPLTDLPRNNLTNQRDLIVLRTSVTLGGVAAGSSAVLLMTVEGMYGSGGYLAGIVLSSADSDGDSSGTSYNVETTGQWALVGFRWMRGSGGFMLTTGLLIGSLQHSMVDEFGNTDSRRSRDLEFGTYAGWRFGGAKRKVLVEAGLGVITTLAGGNDRIRTSAGASYGGSYDAGGVTPLGYLGVGYTF
jgi:hypothetical protein